MFFRRRPLRRRRFRPGLHALRRALRSAHRALEHGDFEAAASTFTMLSQEAVELDLPAAPNLLVQAGRAMLGAGRQSDAKDLFQRAFRMMADRHDFRLGSLSRRLLAELRAEGHDELAEGLEGQLDSLPSAATLAASPAAAAPRARLPAKCPWCGGNVHTDEVDWPDADRPECAYCGSPLLEAPDADG